MADNIPFTDGDSNKVYLSAKGLGSSTYVPDGLTAYLAGTTMARVSTSAGEGLPVQSIAGSQADGHSESIGAKSDAAAGTGSSGSVIAQLKRLAISLGVISGQCNGIAGGAYGSGTVASVSSGAITMTDATAHTVVAGVTARYLYVDSLIVCNSGSAGVLVTFSDSALTPSTLGYIYAPAGATVAAPVRWRLGLTYSLKATAASATSTIYVTACGRSVSA